MAIIIVDTANDVVADDGVTSLSEAITLANADSAQDTGLPPLKWSSTMFRESEEDQGQQAPEAGRDCHEVTAG
ncbi:MAG: hypothetical protein AAF401_17080 [Pseudomonadota bacterium]